MILIFLISKLRSIHLLHFEIPMILWVSSIVLIGVIGSLADDSKILMELSNSVNDLNNNGLAPIHMASQAGKNKIVELLINLMCTLSFSLGKNSNLNQL